MNYQASFKKVIKGSKLRSRFIFFFIVLAVFPLLILGSVSLYLIDTSHRHDVSQLELQLINQKIEEVSKFFADTSGIIELRVGFTQKSEIELSQQVFLLESILEETRAFEEASFIGLNGVETSKNTKEARPSELEDVSELDKFKIPLLGERYIGDVYYTISGPAVTIASPVRNRNGAIIQILSAEVNLSQIIRSIESAQLGGVGYLVVIDKAGYLIGHRTQSDLTSGISLEKIERVKQVLEGRVLTGLEERDRYVSFLSRQPVVGSGKKVPNIGWALLAEWPLSDADAVISDIRNQILLYALVSIIAVLMFAPLFAWRLEEPIRRLERGAKELERGNFESKVLIKSGDELEDLGNAFNKMASGLKRLKELREEFVFIAAHELRSPVTVIKGYASMILEKSEGLTRDIIEYIDEINLANNRLVQLVEDLLEVARSEAGRINIEPKELDMRVPVGECVRELKPLADQKFISLDYKPEESLPNVMGDNSRIKEVVVNLAGNAIKYTQNGGYVKIYHELVLDELITHIEDNGFGIPKDSQVKIFEKFYRVQTDKTKDIQGTGLGLFIVKQIVEKMGGKIWFKSEEHKGSVFSFSLKVAK